MTPTDKWDQYAAPVASPPPAASTDKWDQYAAPAAPAPGPLSRFASSYADTTGIPQAIDATKNAPQPSGAWDTLKQGVSDAFTNSPPAIAVRLGKAIYQQGATQLGKAKDVLTKGDYPSQPMTQRIPEAAGYAASALPIVGPMAAKAGEQIGSGDYAGGAGTAAGAITQAIAPTLSKGVGRAAKAVVPDSQALATRLYGSALKPPPSLDIAERQAIIQTGLKEGIVLTPDVVQNVQSRIDDLNSQISDRISQATEAGATVDPEAVADYTSRSLTRARNQVNPDTDVAAVQSARREFINNQSIEAPYTKIRPSDDEPGYTSEGEETVQVPQPIPIAKAQQLKQGTYAKLKDSYGEQVGFSREAQKDLARGLKDQIVQAFPEIGTLNARESSLLNLESSLTRFAGREGNKQLIGLGTPMTAVAAHAIGAPALPLTLLKAALEMPEIKSRIAIALAKAGSKGASKGVSSGMGLADDVAGAMNQPSDRKRTSMPPPQ